MVSALSQRNLHSFAKKNDLWMNDIYLSIRWIKLATAISFCYNKIFNRINTSLMNKVISSGRLENIKNATDWSVTHGDQMSWTYNWVGVQKRWNYATMKGSKSVHYNTYLVTTLMKSNWQNYSNRRRVWSK